MSALVITGTDTDVGKTVVASALAGAIAGACYWKPIQAGLADGTDRDRVKVLSGLSEERLLPEAYRLTTPASPHLAARLDRAEIDLAYLTLPELPEPLIVEGAGGVLVPVNPVQTMADLFSMWGVPVLLVARTSLGTINHSLLSVEALRARGVEVGGIIFSGDADVENERIIPRMAGVPHLGRLPRLDPLNHATLAQAVRDHLDLAAIERLLA